MPLPAVASFAEFAAIRGWRRSYVTALKKAGRLVLTDDGKAVKVPESLARIKETADPARVGVQARHAATRAKAQGVAQPAADGAAPGAKQDADASPAAEPGADPAAEVADEGFHYWRRRSEKAKALAAERENAIAEGKLMDAAEVAAAIASATTSLRVRMEALPDTLGPQIAAMRDEGEVRATLAEAIEHALAETARQFSQFAKEVPNA